MTLVVFLGLVSYQAASAHSGTLFDTVGDPNSASDGVYALTPGRAAGDGGTQLACPDSDQRGVLLSLVGSGDGVCVLDALDQSAPVAVDDSYTVAEDTTLMQVAPGFLANDVDPLAQGLTAVLVSGPSHGALVLEAGGSFGYIPATNFFGSDAFTYKATDGTNESNVATVTIAVTAVNDAPVAVNDTVTTTEDVALVLPPVRLLGNDTDVDGPGLTIASFTQPGHGVVGPGPNGALVYTPDPNFAGADAFTYIASDGSAASNSATVAVAVMPDAYLEVTNVCDSGPGSLRDAIALANSAAAADTINFALADSACGAGTTIFLLAPLSPISAPVLIDGSGAGNPIVVDGSQVVAQPGASASGFVIADGGGSSALRSLTVQNFAGDAIAIVDAVNDPRAVGSVTIAGNTLSGNGGNGVAIYGAGSNEATIVASGGHTIRHNTITGNGGAGILVVASASDLIDGNSLADNAGGAIDLGGDGPTPNDAGDADFGANLVQNYPQLYQSYPSGQVLVVSGLLDSKPGDYDLQFFAGTGCDSGPQVLLNAEPWRVTIAPAASATYSQTAYFKAQLAVAGAVQPYVGQFVRATATDADGNTSEFSFCTRVSPTNNDSWPFAQLMPLTPGGDSATGVIDSGYVDQLGQSRWYKFTVAPYSKVEVILDNLPANFDLTLYKDIRAVYDALRAPAGNADLARLGAEFAGDAFNPDALAPDAFDSAAYSAEGFSAEGFSAEGFSPDVYSAEGFSAEGFSAEGFSAEGFSAEGFSAEGFSAEGFSAEGFSAEGFSAEGFSAEGFSAEGFSSAPLRSLLGVSAYNGTAQEAITVNTWNNSGEFYVRVRGRDGAFDANQPFRLTVTQQTGACPALNDQPLRSAPSLAAAAGDFSTVILYDAQRMAGRYGAGPMAALRSKLALLAAAPGVAGVVVDVGADAAVAAANAEADAMAACPYLKNRVAASIQDIVDAYRQANPNLAYVVIVGNDDMIPFVRYPDSALLAPESNYYPPVLDETPSQAALRLGLVLSQDAYGASTAISYKTGEFPIPDLAVGRLVEGIGPNADLDQINAVIDAYLATGDGVAAPVSGRALVTGYDFLADAAAAIQAELAAGLTPGAGSITPAVDALITPYDLSPEAPTLAEGGQVWTATDLGDLLLNNRYDLVFLAGHFSASSALAADYRTRLTTAELAAAAVNMTNALVYSAGCHAGYNLVDGHGVPGVTNELDWAQAFAGKGATLIAGTGYQYGDTDFIEYSERLYLEFTRQLRAGTGPVAVGDALVAAKQRYLADTPQLVGLHQKALLETTLFGLPMLRYNLPGERLPAQTRAANLLPVQNVTSNPGLQLGLQTADLAVAPALMLEQTTLKNVAGGADVTATWLEGPDGVQVKPVEPVLPLARLDVSVPGTTLRGVGFRGGTYADTPGVWPLNGTPVTEIRGVHAPFQSPVFFPLQPWSVNYLDTLATGGATRLAVTPAQHMADSLTTSIRRHFSAMDFRLFYSNHLDGADDLDGAALAAPPTIMQVTAEQAGGAVNFQVLVVGNPAAGIQEVWITYTGTDGAWHGRWNSLDLTQNPADSRLWTGSLPLNGMDPASVRFMVQAANGVGLTSLSTNFGAYYIPGAGDDRVATTLSIAPLGTGAAVYGTQITLTATLRDDAGQPLANQRLQFEVGTQSKSAMTGNDGSATAVLQVRDAPGTYAVAARFLGDGTYAQATAATGPVTVTPRATRLCVAAADAGGNDCTTTEIVGDKDRLPSMMAALSSQPLPGQPQLNLADKEVRFTVVNQQSGTTYVEAVTTDYAGRAFFSRELPEGVYSVQAAFAGEAPLLPAQSAAVPLTLLVNWPPDGTGGNQRIFLPVIAAE